MPIHLSAALEPLPQTMAILDGSIAPEGYEFEFTDENITRVAFRRMVRETAYDVCDLAIGTYLTAKDNGAPITAVPIFLTRAFDHRHCFVNVHSGVGEPRDLEGKRVGVRYYGWTNGIWARGLLSDRYGVDLEKVTFVTTDDEHVNTMSLPGNVEYRPGVDLAAMLEAGELAGLIGPNLGHSPNVELLISNSAEAAAEWYAATSILPIHHIVVVKNSRLDGDPTFVEGLIEAFAAAKQPVLDRIARGEVSSDAEVQLAQQAELLGSDPRPYGVEENRVALEAILRYVHEQHFTARCMSIDEVFAPFGS